LVASGSTTDSSGRRFWNATDGCCDFERREIDDVGYIDAVIDDMRAQYNIDPRRIFLLGHSNGGFMAHRLACDRAGIDGILSVAGPSPLSVTSCDHAPRRVLHVHGDADDVVAFEGGHVFQTSSPHASAETSVLARARPSPGNCSWLTQMFHPDSGFPQPVEPPSW
jgi:polyhydroxybutyrate depolymerase